MTVMRFGDGTPIGAEFGDSTQVFGPGSSPAPATVRFTLNAATFAPRVQLHPQLSATVTWADDTGTEITTGLTPTITLSHTPYVVQMRCANPAAVRSLNLGFNDYEDAGRDGPGGAHNKAPDPVTGITGLNQLTGLVQFMAADTPLTGKLDLSGMASLVYVECYDANITSIDLTGCSSLLRLCLETNALSALDLNPVRTTLRDLRAAAQSTPSLTFAPMTGPLPLLWHYCIRDQRVVNSVQHAHLPAVEQRWDWNTYQTTMDAPISPILGSYISSGNTFDAATVNRILTGLDAVTSLSGGYLDLSGSAAPTGAGVTAREALIARGWTIAP